MLIAMWVILIVLLAWLSLTELPAGWDGHKPLPYLIALTPFLWIAFVALCVIGICMRDWPFTVCSVVALIASLMRQSAYWLNDIKAPNTAAALARYLAARNAGTTNNTNGADANDADANDADAGTPHAANTRGTRTAHTTSAPSADRGRFRVLTLNCRYGHADAEQIVRLVRAEDVAVLALQELSEDIVDRLDAAGLRELLPYRELGEPLTTDNGGFNGVWMRVEPSESTPTGVPIPAADVPTMTIPLSSTRNITFASAHPKSPMRGCRDWSAGIIGLRALIRHPKDEPREQYPTLAAIDAANAAAEAEASADAAAHDTFIQAGISAHSATADRDTHHERTTAPHTNTTTTTTTPTLDDDRETICVVMGDLNASIPHPSFRKLLAAGFHDAALTDARGVHPTYPSWLRWPRIVLDHVLFTDYLTASDVRSIKVDATDHLALAATLTIVDHPTPLNAGAGETWPDSLPPLARERARDRIRARRDADVD
ncbi:endonuclease/exonuclease/phosphatase family protein [Bifidobacterium criceti]|uniref:Endonuclease/exonuclease/phosphatase n=1 Tax=Bifidobacterium criceti TaxID=1960969 RepID=A0A2A2EGH4_9BIFI|nr:endonuclease/exonuclease/phosphatase family protein [Bifidobacterium criceti]PAU68072.1 endonuclease/exonuclease/phosphatase [Bifidobacterium criceti]